jgi:putative transposase
VKYQFIKAHRERYRVERMCAALDVSSSGFYEWVKRPESARSGENRRLLKRIQAIHRDADENYGAYKTWRALRSAGERCGRHRVARLRRENGIEAKRVRRFRAASAARNTVPAAPNVLDQDFRAERADRAWVGDITFIPTRRGWLYLAVLVDLYSRRIVGWSMGERINQSLVCGALKMALEQRRPAPGLIHHTDQGAQYTASAYQAMLKAHDLVPSMSRKGNCYDNACAESFFSTLKNELVHHRDFHDREEARMAIFAFIELFYNRRRSHEYLDYRSPEQFEAIMAVA